MSVSRIGQSPASGILLLAALLVLWQVSATHWIDSPNLPALTSIATSLISGIQSGELPKVFGVATGQPAYPTPLGRFTIVSKQLNPWWYPPASDWARGLSPVPPGPGNPLGTRWMGLSVPAVGIHGTPDAASIGYSASHGCIRMQIPDAEWLFEHVSEGTTVFIV